MAAGELSLYLKLEPDRKADAEAVANAVLAYSAALRSVANTIDPFGVLRVELVAGEESSLNLKFLTRYLSPGSIIGAGTALAIAGAGWVKREAPGILAAVVVDHVVEELIDKEPTLSRADAILLAQQIVEAQKNKEVQEHVRKFYAFISWDTAINAVGASTSHEEPPDELVPRAEIERRSGVAAPPPEPPPELNTRTFEHVSILVMMPALVSEPKKWRVIGPDGNHWAMMRDEVFLQKMRDRTTNIPFGANLELDVDFRIIDEKNADGLWVPKDREILKVHGFRERRQETLRLQ